MKLIQINDSPQHGQIGLLFDATSDPHNSGCSLLQYTISGNPDFQWMPQYIYADTTCIAASGFTMTSNGYTLLGSSVSWPACVQNGQSDTAIMTALHLIVKYPINMVGQNIILKDSYSQSVLGFTSDLPNVTFYKNSDNTTSIAVPAGVPTMTNPSAVTVTVTYQSGQYNISTNVPIYNTTFSGCLVKGYTSATSCGGGAVDSDNISSFTTSATGGTSFTQTNYGLSCTSKRYIVAGSITINGTNCPKNTTTTVNGTAWTVNINNTTCSVYPC